MGMGKKTIGKAHKLTPEQVWEIRDIRANTGPGIWAPRGKRYRELAAKYGVNIRTVIAAAMGITWRHL